MSADLSAPVRSIAEQAKVAGAAVGIATSVSVDHATPAAFYAHVGNRSCYHEIGAGSELFGGRVDNTVIPEKIAEATGWTLSSPSR